MKQTEMGAEGGKIQMKKIFMTFSEGIREKMFHVLALTACIANAVGFISNGLLYGMTIPTIVCGICFIVVALFGAGGLKTRKTDLPVIMIILIVSWIEFPFLYYVYGNTTIVYMVLGIVGLAVVFPRRLLWLFYVSTVMVDIAVILIAHWNPYKADEVNPDGLLGSTICSFIIVATSVYFIIMMLIERYEKQNTRILEMSKKLEQAANQDVLTKLYNRLYLIDTLQKWTREPERKFLVVLLDIDNFKKLNDTYGHLYGDEVLKELGRLMWEAMQEKGIAARFGGEEFMLVFDSADRGQVLKTLTDISKGIKEFGQKTRQIDITFSGGIESYCSQTELDNLFTAADQKLYQAKKNGKNQIVG